MLKSKRFTKATGAPVPDNTNILTASRCGLPPLQDVWRIERARTSWEESKMKSMRLSILTALATLVTAPVLMGQTMVHIGQGPVGRVHVPRVPLNLPPQLGTSNVRIAGFSDPSRLPYPLVSAPASDAWARNNGWAADNANLRPILGMAGLPAGPSQAPYPVPRTLANDALVRSNAWAAYNACTRLRVCRLA
jgi:hypothetical protein